MIVLVCIVGWLVVGFGTLAASIWISPDKFDAKVRAANHGTVSIWLDIGQSEVAMLTAFTVICWPAAIVAVAVVGFRTALIRAIRR